MHCETIRKTVKSEIQCLAKSLNGSSYNNSIVYGVQYVFPTYIYYYKIYLIYSTASNSLVRF